MLGSLLWALGLTLVLEEGFALLWGVRSKRDLGLVALVNCITNPLVNVLYRLGRLWGWPRGPVVLALEVAAVLAEWLCYRKTENAVRYPLLFSLCANAFSFCCGLVLQVLVF